MKCVHCNHLYEEHEEHRCPMAEYLNKRDELISDAVEYDEVTWWDENGKHQEK